MCIRDRKKNGDVVDARDYRIQSLNEPIRARDAATKGYVDAKVIPPNVQSNLSVGNVRITQLAPPVNNKDAANWEFLNEHTIDVYKRQVFLCLSLITVQFCMFMNVHGCPI